MSLLCAVICVFNNNGRCTFVPVRWIIIFMSLLCAVICVFNNNGRCTFVPVRWIIIFMSLLCAVICVFNTRWALHLCACMVGYHFHEPIVCSDLCVQYSMGAALLSLYGGHPFS